MTPKKVYLSSEAEAILAGFVSRFQAASTSEALRRVLREMDEEYRALDQGASIRAVFPQTKKDKAKAIILRSPLP
jgi:hypothetical protein